MEFIKKLQDRPILYGIFTVLFMIMPTIVAGWWSLFSDKPMIPTIAESMGRMDIPDISIKWFSWITIPLGLGMLGYIIFLARKGKLPQIAEPLDSHQKSKLQEDEEIINDTLSPLKIEVLEDGNAYFDVGDLFKGGRIGQGRKQILSIRIHNTGGKTIDDVEVCVNKIEPLSERTSVGQIQLPIYLHITGTESDVGSLAFSPDQRRSVDVLSYSTAHYDWHVYIESIGKELKPKLFIGELISYKIEIKVTGRGVDSSRQDFEISMTNPPDGVYTPTTQLIFMKRVFKENQVLKEQQKPKLRIDFNENDTGYFYESDNFKKVFSLKTLTARCLNREKYFQLYRISIYNPSKDVTIKDVSATLNIPDNCPEDLSGKLPVYLHFMNEEPYKKAIDIPPLSRRFTDVIMWQLLPRQGTPELAIYHAVENLNIVIPIYDNKQAYEIKVEVSGEDAKCESKCFFIGLKDKESIFNKNWFHPI